MYAINISTVYMYLIYILMTINKSVTKHITFSRSYNRMPFFHGKPHIFTIGAVWCSYSIGSDCSNNQRASNHPVFAKFWTKPLVPLIHYNIRTGCRCKKQQLGFNIRSTGCAGIVVSERVYVWLLVSETSGKLFSYSPLFTFKVLSLAGCNWESQNMCPRSVWTALTQ